ARAPLSSVDAERGPRFCARMRKQQSAHLIVFITAIQRRVASTAAGKVTRVAHLIVAADSGTTIVRVAKAQHIRDIPTARPRAVVVGSRESLMIAKRHALDPTERAILHVVSISISRRRTIT